MNQLLSISNKNDIPKQYQDTPIGLLLEYHNLKRDFDKYSQASILIGMCMDNRKRLQIPDNFAYIIRSGGGNLRYSEFKVSFAIAVGGVNSIALIGHSQCGMVDLKAKKDQFVEGLVQRAGWDKTKAEDQFNTSVPLFEIDNAMDFVVSESRRLRTVYPGILIAPLMYRVEDNLLYMINSQKDSS
ncbi:carbonic anhydrase [Chloroflexota bacterium]